MQTRMRLQGSGLPPRHSDREWGPPPRDWTLGADAVHLWRASLAPGAEELARLARVLSEEERSRAERFRFPVHRDRFVAGRGIQRLLLARYLDADPASLVYRAARHGKPEFAGPLADRGLRFNVSNAGDRMLLGVTMERELGVDLEEVRPMSDALPIARRFFSAAENEVFAVVTEEERDAAFFACWTRKEAFIKAVGDGLTMPLDSFDVTLRRGEPARLICTRPDPAEAARWTLREVDAGPGWAAAIVVAGRDVELRMFDWGRRDESA